MFVTYLLYFGIMIYGCVFAWLAGKNSYSEFSLINLSFAGHKLHWNINRISLFLCCASIPMILFAGLRWETGVDHMGYYWMFTYIRDNLETHSEIGFYMLCQLVLYFTEDISVLFLICSAITVVFTVVAIKQNSKNPLISMFLYFSMGFYFYSMNSIRHFIALSIYLFAIKYIKSKQFWHYLAWVLVAASFHKIALVAIPLYFVLNIKWKVYWYAIFSTGLLVILMFNRQILDFVYRFFFDFYQGSEAQYTGISWANVLITLSLSVLVFLYRKKLLERDKCNSIFINAAYFGLMFFSLCGWIPEYTRIGQFLTILALFLIPEIIACEEHKNIKTFYTVGLFVAFTAYLALIIWNSQAPTIELAPYKSVFQRTLYYDGLKPFWFFPG